MQPPPSFGSGAAALEASYEAAGFHSAYVMARNNLIAIGEFVQDSEKKAVSGTGPIRAALLRLLEFQLLVQVRDGAGAWLGLLTPAIVDAMFARVNALLDELRPDAVTLCDAFGFTDYSLGSTIGRADGNVYEAIYNEARLSPLNQTRTMVGWDRLRDIFDLQFLREGVGQRWEPPAKL